MANLSLFSLRYALINNINQSMITLKIIVFSILSLSITCLQLNLNKMHANLASHKQQSTRFNTSKYFQYQFNTNQIKSFIQQVTALQLDVLTQQNFTENVLKGMLIQKYAVEENIIKLGYQKQSLIISNSGDTGNIKQIQNYLLKKQDQKQDQLNDNLQQLQRIQKHIEDIMINFTQLQSYMDTLIETKQFFFDCLIKINNQIVKEFNSTTNSIGVQSYKIDKS